MKKQAQVPPGYKKTEAGVIPEDWVIKELKEIASVKTGPFGSALHESDYVNDGTPIITVEHLSEFGITTQNLPLVSDTDLKRLSAYQLKSGDIVFSRVGSVDRNSLVTMNESGWLFSGRLLRIRIINESVFPKYLSYHFHQESFKDRVKSVAVGQTMPSLNTKILNGIAIVFPPTLTEQRAIATALSDVDDLIAALDRLISKKRAIKQGTMQELLTGRKRLPGFAKASAGAARYKETEAGVVPEDWDCAPIGEHFDFKNGLNKEKAFFGEGTPIVNYMDVYKSPGLFQKDILGKVTLTPEEIRNYSAKKGDVFFTRTSETVEEIGMASTLLEDIPDAVFSGFILRARPKTNRLTLVFRQYCFRTEVVRKQITATSSYTTRALTNGRLLSKVFIPLPRLHEEQNAIAKILSDMDAEIESLEQKRDKYQSIKQGMMQELLTGKTRLI